MIFIGCRSMSVEGTNEYTIAADTTIGAVVNTMLTTTSGRGGSRDKRIARDCFGVGSG